MTKRFQAAVQFALVLLLGFAASGQSTAAATLQSATSQAWNAYVAATEARIDAELRASGKFLTTDFTRDDRVTRDAIARGDIPIGKLTALDRHGNTIDVPDGLIAHWRGAVFLPGVSLDALLHRLQHPSERGPHQQDVVSLRVLDRQPDRVKLAIRMTRTKIVTVTYDTEHAVEYRRAGTAQASSRSVSTKIVEVQNAGTTGEHALPEGNDRGFLWRMNSYWRYEQVNGGVIVELESLTLSRSIPLGLSVIVEPIIDRIARESIHRTLDNMRRTYRGPGVLRAAGGQ